MENLSLCEGCVCAPVCDKLRAVGPVSECDTFYGVARVGDKMDLLEPKSVQLDKQCAHCSAFVMTQDRFCPRCGVMFPWEGK